MVDPKTGKFFYEEPEDSIYDNKIENMRKLIESYDNLKNIPDPTQHNTAKETIINDIDKDNDTITYF